MIDPDALQELVQGYFYSKVLAVFDETSGGSNKFKRLLTTIRKLYRVIEPSTINGSITVFSRASEENEGLSGSHYTLGSIEQLQTVQISHLCLEIMNSGSIRRWITFVPPNWAQLSASSIVYSYQSGLEGFWLNGEQAEVPNAYTGEHSIFQLPAYQELEQAMAGYKHRVVALRECDILEKIWFDDRRLFLSAKPESTMRSSLIRFLNWNLRADVEVMPEQNVDSSHPVDVKVTYDFANRVALIEIKWLGSSKDTEGKITTTYSMSRARDGALQLAEYLDWYRDSSPNRIARGYLLVFDCRRRSLASNPTELPPDDGFYFQDREIVFDPAYHLTRSDFAEPIRMFAEPICD